MHVSYCWLVVSHPFLLVISTIALSLAFSAIGIFFHYDTIDFDPGKGFETRGTFLSEGKLILDGLIESVAEPIDIYKSSFKMDRHRRSAPQREDPDLAVALINEIEDTLVDELEDFKEGNISTVEPITVNYDEYGVDSEPNEKDLNDPCTQYSAMGKKIPYDAFDILAKLIVRTKPEKLFTVETFKSLCEVDEIVEKIVKEHEQGRLAISQLKHSFNLPFISTCMNLKSRKTCEAINQKDIDFFKTTIEICRREKEGNDLCNLPLIQQAMHYLLPTEGFIGMAAIVLNIQRSANVNASKAFDAIQNSLRSHFRKSEIELVGVDFGNKSNQFLSALAFDSLLSLISAFLVLSTFFIYSRSILFTGIIFLLIVLSMTLAFFTYTVVFQIDFFPFINLLVIVLMTSVGADDAFLLLAYYRIEKEKLSGPWKPGDVYLPKESLHIRCLQKSLRHSLISMFITSATTAVAFLSNLSSEIIVLRCFGIYASLTVIFNYILVIFVLPSTIMLTQSDKSLFQLSLGSLIQQTTKILQKLRFLIVFVSFGLTCLSFFAVFFVPGLRLPQYNPTTLLIDSNPHEWFDTNAHLFDFEWKRSFKIQKYFLIGDIRIKNIRMLSPYSKGNIILNPLKITENDVNKMKISFSNILEKSGFQRENAWISDYGNFSCSSKAESKCFLDFSLDRLPSLFPEDFSKNAFDGPLFDKNLNIIGYYFSIPSKITLTAEAQKVQKAFKQIYEDCNSIRSQLDLPLRCMSSAEISRYYDIIERLWPSTLSSVGISIVVSLLVVILCTRRFLLSIITVIVICCVVMWTTASLVAFGWQLSVVESTIIVLTIGLSFDFSLHIAASIKESKQSFMLENIRSALSSAGTACSLAALSSVLCGIPLIFAQTAAFQQVGMMLVALGIISWIGAVIVLPAALLCTNCSGSSVSRI